MKSGMTRWHAPPIPATTGAKEVNRNIRLFDVEPERSVGVAPRSFNPPAAGMWENEIILLCQHQ
jgi:hypothetical protein